MHLVFPVDDEDGKGEGGAYDRDYEEDTMQAVLRVGSRNGL